MNEIKNVIDAMLGAFNSILTERMYEEEDEYIRQCLMESVSPVIRIDYHNGIVLCINRDEYGNNDIIKATHDYGNEADVFIDGRNIFDWQ